MPTDRISVYLAAACIIFAVKSEGINVQPKLKWGQDYDNLFLQLSSKCSSEDPGPTISLDRFQLECGQHTLDLSMHDDIVAAESQCKTTRSGVSCKFKKRNSRLWDRLTVDEKGLDGFGTCACVRCTSMHALTVFSCNFQDQLTSTTGS